MDNQDLNFDSPEILEALGAVEGENPSIFDREEDEPQAPDTAEGVDEPAPPAEERVPDEQGGATDADPIKLRQQVDNLNAALREQREKERAKEAQYQQQLSQVQQQMQAFQAQQQEAAMKAQLEALQYDDPDAAAAFIHQQREALAQQYQAELANQRVQMALELTRATHPDFDSVVMPFLQSPAGQALNLSHFESQPNPTKALYDYVKAQQPVDRDALREELKKELLAELAPRLQAQQSRGPRGIGSLPASSTAPDSLDKRTANTLHLAEPGTDEYDAAVKRLLSESYEG